MEKLLNPQIFSTVNFSHFSVLQFVLKTSHHED